MIRPFTRCLILLLLTADSGMALPPAFAEDDHAHRGVPERFRNHPAVGETAPGFTLCDPGGGSWSLGEFLGRGHLILLFGSVSSDGFKKCAAEFDRLAEEWKRLEVRGLVIYTREAHPARLRKEAPKDYPDRVKLAGKTRRDLGIALPFLVDEWDDAAHKAYGGMPDSAFLLDLKGIIAARQVRCDAKGLDRVLRRRLGIPKQDAEP